MTKVTRLVIYFYVVNPNVCALQGCNTRIGLDASILRLVANGKPAVVTSSMKHYDRFFISYT
jgi:hypothetical protein